MLLRPMRAADLAGLGEVHELRRPALAGAQGSGPTDDRDRAAWQHTARHVLDTDPAGCWSAEDDAGAVVGGVLSLRREGLWVVSTLAVLPYAARLGAGALLLERAGAYGAAALRSAVCLSTPAEVADAGLYRAYGLRVHPTVRLSGTVERSGLPVVSGVHEVSAAWPGLPDSVDWLVRGAPRGADHAVLARGGSVLVADTSTGRGYACVHPGSVTALSATDLPTARTLLWEALARSEGEVALERVTAEQDWAVEVAVRAGLSVASAGVVCLRGMRPPWGTCRPPACSDPACHHGTVTTPTDAAVFVDPEPTPLALLLLGRDRDLASERGVECPGDLPAASDPHLVERARVARAALGDAAFVLGHHYQRDEVIAFADVTGDSFRLAQQAAARPESPYVVFCGVHFMAESADILTAPHQQVVLPDLAAGCSMADMATATQVQDCWDTLVAAGVAEEVVPVSYMNSSADIKAFTGEHGGTICTSSNAAVSLRWAFAKGSKVLFLPDQHLGRNTAVSGLGMSLADCVVYDPHKPGGGLTTAQLQAARMILWRGHCSVHGRFSLDSVADVRSRVPDVQVLVHPECTHEVVLASDLVGSTEFIIRTIEAAPAGSAWAIGTELNLVKRLAQAHPEQRITFLDRSVCFCSTMNRIDLPHLVWTLESLVAGRVVNQISVEERIAHWARVALEQMLALPQG